MSPKYNRTYHLPFSPGATSDDKVSNDINNLINRDIIITEKMDGGNASLEANGLFARTHASIPTHPSFDELKAFHAGIKYKIPADYQLFGENCFAKHSIQYSALPGYFLLFNVRNTTSNVWLSWEEVELWADEIGVPTVPVLFKGSIKNSSELEDVVSNLVKEPSACGGDREGIVVRVAEQFFDSDFYRCVAKWVRKDHVTTDQHWSQQEIIRNKLKI